MRKTIELLDGHRAGRPDIMVPPRKCAFWHFDSPANWLTYLREHRVVLGHNGDEWLAYENWTGRRFKNYEEVYSCMDTVWEKGMHLYSQMAARLDSIATPEPTSIIRRRRYSENDGEVNVDRFIAGETAFFEECYKMRTLNGCPVITIVSNVSNSGALEWEDMFWNSATAIYLSDKLEKAGYVTEVIGYDYTMDSHPGNLINDSGSAVIVKAAGQTVDISSMVSAMSSFASRLLFILNNNLPGAPRVGIGMPCAMSETAARACLQLNGKVIFLDNVGRFDRAAEQAQTVLAAVLADQA